MIPELRFPEFVNDGEWVEKKLENVSVKIQDGTHFSPKSFDDGDFLYITSKNVKNGYIDLSTAQYVTQEDHDHIYQRCDVKQGDVLLTKDGTIGQACVNELSVPFSLLSSVAFIRLKPKYSNYFLYHLLVSHLGQKEIKSQIAGQALRRITLTKIKNFNFSFPELHEQQKIASCLSSLDELIAAHNDKLAALKDHKKGLLQNLFPKQGETVPKVRFPEFEGDGEWIVDSLSNCADVIDPHPSHRAPAATNEGVPFIGIGDISENGKLDWKNVRIVGHEILYEHQERYTLKTGDFAYGRVASIGKVVDLSENVDKGYTYSPTMAIIQPYSIDSSYLKQFCNSGYFISQVNSKTTGSTRKSIGMQNLRILNVCRPKSKLEQQKIASCLSAVDELITAQQEKIEELQQHKKGLMQGLFPKMVST